MKQVIEIQVCDFPHETPEEAVAEVTIRGLTRGNGFKLDACSAHIAFLTDAKDRRNGHA